MMEAILFDLEGTVVDTRPAYFSALNKLLVENGKEEISEKRFYAEFSKSNEEILEGLEFEKEKLNDYSEKLLDYCIEDLESKMLVLDNSKDLILKLSDIYQIGIVSNSRKKLVEKVMDCLKLDCIDAVVCREDVKDIKPAPDCINKACDYMSVEPKCCMLVGDSKNDILSGKAAEVGKIVIRPYKCSEKEVAGADYVINELSEVYNCLLGDSSKAR